MKKWTVVILVLIALCWLPIIALAAGVNSENKRRSVIYMLPKASGAISLYDRMQVATLYRLIPSGAGGVGHRRGVGMGMYLKGGFAPHRPEDY